MRNTKRKQISELEYSDHIFAKEPHLEYKPIDESKALTLTFDEYPDNSALKEDWDKILSLNPKKICYAHAGSKDLTLEKV